MSTQNIEDVWRTIDDELGIHCQDKDNFEQIPDAPGVYAWFYPLYVTSRDFDEFLEQIRKVHLYDAWSKGVPRLEDEAKVGWLLLKRTIQFENPPIEIGEGLRKTWESLAANDDDFFRLREVFMRASLLMPPLYVGKAGTLNKRCYSHIRGISKFAERYERRAEELELTCRNVKDLLLLTLKTSSIDEEAGTAAEDLVEKVLNLVARPPYGMK